MTGMRESHGPERLGSGRTRRGGRGGSAMYAANAAAFELKSAETPNNIRLPAAARDSATSENAGAQGC